MFHWLSVRASGYPTLSYSALSDSRQEAEVYSIHRESVLENATRLVVVCGHGIWKGSSGEQKDPLQWLLGPESRDVEVSIDVFLKHIDKGVQMTLDDPSSILIFSGGRTRPGSTLSEGQSYYRLAQESDRASISSHASLQRTFTEDYALDSYQNLVFSIARFHEVTGRYPEHVSVVGFGMKGRRFRELHAHAIRWPASRFDYIGIDLEGDTTEAYAGEHRYGYTPFTADLYGCHGTLSAKRIRRNLYLGHHPYYSSSPEMENLLRWCPSNPVQLFTGPLPWDVL